MTRHLSLVVDDRPETLLRVTGLCLRRRADVVGLRYTRSRGTRAGFARLELELGLHPRETGTAGSAERQWRTLVERLNALVEVRHVAEIRAVEGGNPAYTERDGRRLRALPARDGAARVR